MKAGVQGLPGREVSQMDVVRSSKMGYENLGVNYQRVQANSMALLAPRRPCRPHLTLSCPLSPGRRWPEQKVPVHSQALTPAAQGRRSAPRASLPSTSVSSPPCMKTRGIATSQKPRTSQGQPIQFLPVIVEKSHCSSSRMFVHQHGSFTVDAGPGPQAHQCRL